MPHSAENRKGPMNLHTTGISATAVRSSTALCCGSVACDAWEPNWSLQQTGQYSREVFALARSMEAVCCQAANDCGCDHHRLQHNLRRKDRACCAHADAEAERLRRWTRHRQECTLTCYTMARCLGLSSRAQQIMIQMGTLTKMARHMRLAGCLFR
jgi:hypothetical protein